MTNVFLCFNLKEAKTETQMNSYCFSDGSQACHHTHFLKKCFSSLISNDYYGVFLQKRSKTATLKEHANVNQVPLTGASQACHQTHLSGLVFVLKCFSSHIERKNSCETWAGIFKTVNVQLMSEWTNMAWNIQGKQDWDLLSPFSCHLKNKAIVLHY